MVERDPKKHGRSKREEQRELPFSEEIIYPARMLFREHRGEEALKLLRDKAIEKCGKPPFRLEPDAGMLQLVKGDLLYLLHEHKFAEFRTRHFDLSLIKFESKPVSWAAHISNDPELVEQFKIASIGYLEKLTNELKLRTKQPEATPFGGFLQVHSVVDGAILLPIKLVEVQNELNSINALIREFAIGKGYLISVVRRLVMKGLRPGIDAETAAGFKEALEINRGFFRHAIIKQMRLALRVNRTRHYRNLVAAYDENYGLRYDSKVPELVARELFRKLKHGAPDMPFRLFTEFKPCVDQTYWKDILSSKEILEAAIIGLKKSRSIEFALNFNRYLCPYGKPAFSAETVCAVTSIQEQKVRQLWGSTKMAQ